MEEYHYAPPPPLMLEGQGRNLDKEAGTNATQTICPPTVVSKLAPPCNRVPGQAEQIVESLPF